MSRPVCITYDSTCDLTPEMLERFRIRTVPLTIQSGERTFPDDGHYTSADLYADYRKDGILPKTAAVSPQEFCAFFEKKEKIAIDFCGLARYNVFLHETDLFVSVLTLLEEV